MPLCVFCDELRDVCHRFWRVTAVSDGQLSDPEFIRDAKLFVSRLPYSAERLLHMLADWQWEAACTVIVDEAGKPVTIDLDRLAFLGAVDWLKEWRRVPSADVTPHVNKAAWERVRVLLTILKLEFPGEAAMWGLRPANNNVATDT